MKIQGIVNGSSVPKEFLGVMQIGFTLTFNTKQWYNVQGEEEVLNELRRTLLQKGTEISFEYNEKSKEIGDITLLNMPKKEEHKGDWADDMTSFEDLLASAHEKFGSRMHIRTEIVKDGQGNPLIDFEKKRAVFKAQVYIQVNALTDKSAIKDYVQVFEAHGDSTENNISGDLIKPHFIRMAETRAISRALRWATNNAAVAIEETGGQSEEFKTEVAKQREREGAPVKEVKKDAKK